MQLAASVAAHRNELRLADLPKQLKLATDDRSRHAWRTNAAAPPWRHDSPSALLATVPADCATAAGAPPWRAEPGEDTAYDNSLSNAGDSVGNAYARTHSLLGRGYASSHGPQHAQPFAPQGSDAAASYPRALRGAELYSSVLSNQIGRAHV